MQHRNNLFDFESNGSPIMPFDVTMLDYSQKRYLPSPNKPGKWIVWFFRYDIDNQDFIQENQLPSLTIGDFLADVPLAHLQNLPVKDEEAIAHYLRDAARVCYEHIYAHNEPALSPNMIMNPDRYGTTPRSISIATTQLHTLVATAWGFYSMMATRYGRTDKSILPQFGEQFTITNPEDQADASPVEERWQCRVVCNWEPDEDGFARHEVAYGSTEEDARDAALELMSKLSEEWDTDTATQEAR